MRDRREQRRPVPLETIAHVAAWALTVAQLALLVALLVGEAVPLPLLLGIGLVLTGVPAVTLLVRVLRRQELERERARLAARKDGPAVPPPAEGGQLNY